MHRSRESDGTEGDKTQSPSAYDQSFAQSVSRALLYASSTLLDSGRRLENPGLLDVLYLCACKCSGAIDWAEAFRLSGELTFNGVQAGVTMQPAAQSRNPSRKYTCAGDHTITHAVLKKLVLD